MFKSVIHLVQYDRFPRSGQVPGLSVEFVAVPRSPELFKVLMACLCNTDWDDRAKSLSTEFSARPPTGIVLAHVHYG